MGELERKIKEIVPQHKVMEKIIQLLNAAGEEFPCLSCPSKDDCGTFKWYVKWFGVVFG